MQDENVIVLRAETDYQSVVSSYTRTPQSHRTVCRSQGYDSRRQGGERRERGTCMTSDLMKYIYLHTHPSEYIYPRNVRLIQIFDENVLAAMEM